ncbi:hypothetical protein JCM17961_04370 [Endothiovibrio diazotrophicus]
MGPAARSGVSVRPGRTGDSPDSGVWGGVAPAFTIDEVTAVWRVDWLMVDHFVDDGFGIGEKSVEEIIGAVEVGQLELGARIEAE